MNMKLNALTDKLSRINTLMACMEDSMMRLENGTEEINKLADLIYLTWDEVKEAKRISNELSDDEIVVDVIKAIRVS